MTLRIVTAVLLILLVPAGLMAAPRSLTSQKTEEPPVIDSAVDEVPCKHGSFALEFF